MPKIYVTGLHFMTIDLSQYEGLPDEVREKLAADLEGYQSPDEVAGLKQQRDSLLTEKKEAKRLADEAAEQAKKAAHDAAVAKGDVDAINSSWQEKYDSLDSELQGLRAKAEQGVKNSAINDLAGRLADGSNAELLKPFIEKRLRVDDGKVKVTDKDGALTVSSISDLESEFRSDPMFSNLIVANRATGGGANGGSQNTSGAGGQKANLNGNIQEKTAGLAAKIPGFSDLPVK